METHIDAELHGLREKLLEMAGYGRVESGYMARLLDSGDGEMALCVVTTLCLPGKSRAVSRRFQPWTCR